MCDLVCVVISCCVLSCDTGKNMHVVMVIETENIKNIEIFA